MKQILLFIFCVILFNLSVYSQSKVSDLPVYITYKSSNKPLVLFFTGDGGMNSFSAQLIENLTKSGYPLIALDTKKYFWSKKTPSQFAKDLQPLIVKYLHDWHKEEFIIVGYSFGADVSSFLPSNFTTSLSATIKSLVLLSPSYSTGFEVKLMNMLNSGGASNNEKYKVYPELLKANFAVTCVFGTSDDSDFKIGLKETDKIKKVIIPGNHHFNDDINLITKTILKAIN